MPKSPRSSTPRWQNAIVGHAEVDPTTLTPHPHNWRRHPERQQAALDASLDALGWIDEIIVNKTTGHILNGHARLERSIEAGEPTVPVKYVALSEDKESLALLIFDPISTMAGGDAAELVYLMEQAPVDQAELQAIYDTLSMDYGVHPETPPTLDDLEQTYGAPQEEGQEFWKAIMLKVPPDVFTCYSQCMAQAGGDDEAERFAKILAGFQQSTVGLNDVLSGQ